jgi:hypothetical protein
MLAGVAPCTLIQPLVHPAWLSQWFSKMLTCGPWCSSAQKHQWYYLVGLQHCVPKRHCSERLASKLRLRTQAWPLKSGEGNSVSLSLSPDMSQSSENPWRKKPVPHHQNQNVSKIRPTKELWFFCLITPKMSLRTTVPNYVSWELCGLKSKLLSV